MTKRIFNKVFGSIVAFSLVFQLSVLMPTAGAEDVAVIEVTSGEETESFTDFGEGWAYGLKESLDNTETVTITLNADWVATDGMFTSPDGTGICEGALCLSANYPDLVLDLNGHTIDRNASVASRYGQVFFINHDDVNFTLKDSVGGGKITGAFSYASGYGLGGGILAVGGNLTLSGVEVSDNLANYGGGIYWNSDGNLIILDSKITNNDVYELGGGIYHTGAGSIYLGGTTIIDNNKCSWTMTGKDLYLADETAVVKQANGQTGVPNNALKEGSVIRVKATGDNQLISGEGAGFGFDTFEYFYTEDDTHYIRPVFVDNSPDFATIYYTSKTHEEAKDPKITSVSVKDDTLISSASIDVDKQVVTLTAISPDRSNFKDIVIESLVNFTVDDEQTYWRHCDWGADLTAPAEYRVVTKSNGTYNQLTVVVNFPECTEHVDENTDYTCDNCGECLIKAFDITGYDADTKTASFDILQAGSYTVIFADYDGTKLSNVETATIVTDGPDKDTATITKGFTIEKGDKIMLWTGLGGVTNACEVFVLE